MSKIIEKSKYRVVVEPKTYVHGIKLSSIESDCKYMVDQIKRHIDNVDTVTIDYDTREVCSHCGYEWETDPENGEPICCEKAIIEFKSVSNSSVLPTPPKH